MFYTKISSLPNISFLYDNIIKKYINVFNINNQRVKKNAKINN